MGILGLMKVEQVGWGVFIFILLLVFTKEKEHILLDRKLGTNRYLDLGFDE